MLEASMLKIGSAGREVRLWQWFLVGQGFLDKADGSFGPDTRDATIEFQKASNLEADGEVGKNTLNAAAAAGYGPPSAKPILSIKKVLSYADKQKLFGPLICEANPQPGNPEGIRITNNWIKNLQKVEIPQLAGISGAPNDRKVLFHSKGASRLAQLWAKWEADGLLPLVMSWDGAWAPRYIRGSRTVLSSHAFAVAFDINARWNSLGVIPPASGKAGSVRDLVASADESGFFWGGAWASIGRPDGMHFELAGAE
jgi:hypothetical protein